MLIKENIKVEHPIWGEGWVISSRKGGWEYLVEFEFGIKLWILSEELIFKSKNKVKIKSPQKIKTYLPTSLYARQMVEAFRLGIVPTEGVEEFTFGREQELQKIREKLLEFETLGTGVVFVEAPYGGGKTHFLKYIEEMTKKENYATSRIALDPIDVSPYRSKNIYREIIKNFSYNGLSFREFLFEVAKHTSLDGHKFLSPVLQLIREEKITSVVWQWIEGESINRWYQNRVKEIRKLPTLVNFSTATDNYCYILTGIGELVKILGGKGFIIFIDESETLFHLWWRSIALERGVNFFKSFILAVLGKLPTELTPKIYKDTIQNVYVEEVSGYTILHRGISSSMTPYCFKNPAHILLVLAFTPSPLYVYEEIKEVAQNERLKITLPKLKEKEFKKMFVKLYELYILAYPKSLPKLEKLLFLTNQLPQEGIRWFIKSSIEVFDLIRHYPKERIYKFLNFCRQY
jgi:hypothetical protein